MDEIWQWEDSPSDKPTFTVGDMDVFGWAYFKINFSTDGLITVHLVNHMMAKSMLLTLIGII